MKDSVAEHIALVNCGILQTYTDLLSGPHCSDETRHVYERCSFDAHAVVPAQAISQ